MTMSTLKMLLTVTSLTLAAAVPTMAQSPARGTGDQPIMFGADTGSYEGNTVTLRGKAEILQGQNRLRADSISGLNQTGESRIEATGNVYFVTPTETIRGDRAIYTTANDTVVITGDVILSQGQNVLTGASLTYNINTGSARMEGAPAGASGNRVRGVFYPEQRAN